MISIHDSIALFIGSGVQAMQQVSNMYMLWRGDVGTVSSLKIPHSIDRGHWSIELVTCLMLAFPSWAVNHSSRLPMVVFSIFVVWVHLWCGLLPDGVLS